MKRYLSRSIFLLSVLGLIGDPAWTHDVSATPLVRGRQSYGCLMEQALAEQPLLVTHIIAGDKRPSIQVRKAVNRNIPMRELLRLRKKIDESRQAGWSYGAIGQVSQGTRANVIFKIHKTQGTTRDTRNRILRGIAKLKSIDVLLKTLEPHSKDIRKLLEVLDRIPLKPTDFLNHGLWKFLNRTLIQVGPDASAYNQIKKLAYLPPNTSLQGIADGDVLRVTLGVAKKIWRTVADLYDAADESTKLPVDPKVFSNASDEPFVSHFDHEFLGHGVVLANHDGYLRVRFDKGGVYTFREKARVALPYHSGHFSPLRLAVSA